MSVPTNGNDLLEGDAGDNVIDALAGDDIVYGRGGADQLTGGQGVDLLYGEEGDDVLNGSAGADRAEGGPGNDAYYVDDPGDIAFELADAGRDIVIASVSYRLGAHIEDMQSSYIPGTDPLSLTGNDLSNRIWANFGNNLIDGGGGADSMFGYSGDDAYIVDHAGDLTYESADGGRDLVVTSVSYRLNPHVEDMQSSYIPGTNPLSLTGNDLSNRIWANFGNNLIDGGGGADAMFGYGGDDAYIVDHAGDQTYESADGGRDLVVTSVSYRLDPHVEDMQSSYIPGSDPLSLTGNDLANRIWANFGNNLIDGGGGADAMFGYGGDDAYIVDHAGDQTYESADGGRDLVVTSVSYRLNAHVEDMQSSYIPGSDPLSLTGNDLSNRIWANFGNNLIDGGGGADAMFGYGGDDAYIVDHAGDQTHESADGGRDLVVTSVSYRLNAHVEDMQSSYIPGSDPLSLTGNDLSNRIWANFGNNLIDGGGGADAMFGYGGDDAYIVDHAGDQTYESADGGRDLVVTSVSYRLDPHVEDMQSSYIPGSDPLSLTGNDLANRIWANFGNNLIDGGGGADAMFGYGGDDVYVVDHAGDAVHEGPDGGRDTVRTSVSYTLGADVEWLLAADPASSDALSLTGNDLANVISGNAGQNVIDGKGGNDTLTGGAGADTFSFTTALGAANRDTIADFAPGADRILLGGQSGEAFAALASGALAAGAFATGASASEADDRILYDPATGALLYDADGAGGAAAVQFATAGAGLSLTSASFIVSGPANQLSAITSGSTASVAENSLASTIVYQVQASDPDGDSLSFRLDGPDAAKLTIDAAGAVRLVSPADFETQKTYVFTVHALDSSGTGGSRTVTLSITDVVEALPRYLVTDQEANDSSGAAQALDRSKLAPTGDANVPDSSLPSATITGSISTDTDKDFFSITLNAGELLILDVDGTDTLDAELRVFGPNGAEIAINDDPGSFDPGSSAHAGLSHNMDSFIRVRAPTTGTYTFSIASFREEDGRTSTGSYTLHVLVGPTATPAQIDEENIQSMLSGSTWSTLGLSYGFPTSGSQYGPNEGSDEIAAGMQPLNGGQQQAVHTILAQIANVSGLSFVQNAASPGAADLRYALSTDPNTAHAYEPGPGNGGDSWYNTAKYSTPTVGNYQWVTFIHESGHALGLKHGHESPALSPDRDSMEFSVMTYRGYIGAPVGEDGGFTNETWGYAQTLMMYDIAALQRMYGADFTHNAGDTVYSWDPSTGAFRVDGVTQWTPGGNRIFMTVWDGGGIDTYDFSNYTFSVSRTIDLRPGEWTKLGDAQLANLGSGFARGNIANSLLYNGDPRSLIENAIGSQAEDWLIANDASNRLTGSGGADRFVFHSVSASSVAAPDTITDFVSGSEKIGLDGIDAISGTPANDVFSYIGTNAFSGVAGQLRHESVGGTTHIYADVNGDSVADLHIIVNAPVVTIQDFFL
ncbi:MAG TPA: M10 family metallopeptidase C-terminal domain-containing protein [Allosphingosinicella sp.]|nr:M10 family metallopeptidase C-terminal domain-containing protein [Allosphingosinicella sp.]